MQAVKKYDPDKGFRLATYAMWWIRAAIQEYVLKSWSLVKIGTTAAQKKLFFNLKKLRKEIDSQLPKPFTSLFDFYRKVLPAVIALATDQNKYYKVKLNN